MTAAWVRLSACTAYSALEAIGRIAERGAGETDDDHDRRRSR